MCLLQLSAARLEISRLSEENGQFRSMLTHLTTEYHNLQMHVVASMRSQNEALNHSASTVQVLKLLVWSSFWSASTGGIKF